MSGSAPQFALGSEGEVRRSCLRALRGTAPVGRRPGAPRVEGFTLLEVLVSLFVLAVGMLGFASLQGIATKSNANGGVQSRAVSIGQAKMEMLKTSRFQDLVESHSAGTVWTLCNTNVAFAGETNFFTAACTITPRDSNNDGVNDQADLLVTVSYPGAQATWPVRLVSSRSRR